MTDTYQEKDAVRPLFFEKLKRPLKEIEQERQFTIQYYDVNTQPVVRIFVVDCPFPPLILLPSIEKRSR